jgi:hypothetical protein
MLKPLTLSLSLAVALGACSVSMAGLFASSQCPSPQGPCASPQSSCLPSPQCAPRKHWNFHFPKPCFTYEWVLRKKMVWSCGNSACNTCVTPSSQCGPSSQILGSGQAYPTVYGGTYGTGQMIYGAGTGAGAGAMTTPPPAGGEMTGPATTTAPTGTEVPEPPKVDTPVTTPTPEPPGPAGAAPTPTPPGPGPQSSLLFSTPSGN